MDSLAQPLVMDEDYHYFMDLCPVISGTSADDPVSTIFRFKLSTIYSDTHSSTLSSRERIGNLHRGLGILTPTEGR